MNDSAPFCTAFRRDATRRCGRFGIAALGLAVGLAGCAGKDLTGGDSLATGSIALAVYGLPSSTPAAILISSAQGYHQVVTGSVTLSSLTPGAYTISADELDASGDHYVPVSGGVRTVTGQGRVLR